MSMNNKPRVLVIEDDAAIRRGLVDALRFESFEVSDAADANAGLKLALTLECDLILLDLLLPGGDGLEILKQTRAKRPTLPVIILTARGDESDRVKGLSLGADDYVVKPFSIKELIARVRAVLRRSPARPLDVVMVKFESTGVCADLDRREAMHSDGSRFELSKTETDLLRFLASQPGRAVSREEILRVVWMLEPRGLETRTIDMHVARLREKLGEKSGAKSDDSSAEKSYESTREKPAAGQTILTVRGKGYMLAADAVVIGPGGGSEVAR